MSLYHNCFCQSGRRSIRLTSSVLLTSLSCGRNLKLFCSDRQSASLSETFNQEMFVPNGTLSALFLPSCTPDRHWSAPNAALENCPADQSMSKTKPWFWAQNMFPFSMYNPVPQILLVLFLHILIWIFWSSLICWCSPSALWWLLRDLCSTEILTFPDFPELQNPVSQY